MPVNTRRRPKDRSLSGAPCAHTFVRLPWALGPDQSLRDQLREPVEMHREDVLRGAEVGDQGLGERVPVPESGAPGRARNRAARGRAADGALPAVVLPQQPGVGGRPPPAGSGRWCRDRHRRRPRRSGKAGSQGQLRAVRFWGRKLRARQDGVAHRLHQPHQLAGRGSRRRRQTPGRPGPEVRELSGSRWAALADARDTPCLRRQPVFGDEGAGLELAVQNCVLDLVPLPSGTAGVPKCDLPI